MAKRKFTLGLDFGTNSVRSLLVDVRTGKEVATSVTNFAHGNAGVVLDAKDPHLARQHPQDYLDGTAKCVAAALRQFVKLRGVSVNDIIAIGVDTTGSTPIPVDASGVVRPETIVTHTFAASESAKAFNLVDGYKDGVLKAVIDMEKW